MPSATQSKSLLAAKKRLQTFLKSLDTIPYEELEREIPKMHADMVAQTPFKSGKLENSVYVRVSRAKSRVGFVAGASARSSTGFDYAGIQHERTDFNHPIKGKAYYIRDPFDAAVRRIKRRIATRIKNARP